MYSEIKKALDELKNINHLSAFNALFIEAYIEELLVKIKNLKEANEILEKF